MVWRNRERGKKLFYLARRGEERQRGRGSLLLAFEISSLMCVSDTCETEHMARYVGERRKREFSGDVRNFSLSRGPLSGDDKTCSTGVGAMPLALDLFM